MPVPSPSCRRPRSRPLAVLVAALVACLVLAGCSGGGEGGPAGGGVTVRHAFGETEVPAAPQRVVAVGASDADFLLALGVVPVGVRGVVGFDETTRPWAQQALGGARPEQVGGDRIDVEKVAALKPDLIVGVRSSMDQATYDALSGIAPTVADPNPGGVPAPTWQEQTRITGQAVGRTQQAEQVVSDLEVRFNVARVENVALAGRTLSVDLVAANQHTRLGVDDPRAQLFDGLGIDVGTTTETLSTEELSELDADGIAVVGASPQALAGVPTFQALPAVRAGRVAYLGDEASPVAGALGFSSPLSLPYLLDQVVPRLQQVYGG